MISVDELPVIPMWIDGHAYLSVTAAFRTVCNPLTGSGLRRIPLCGTEEVRRAVDSARSVNPAWAALSCVARAGLLTALGDALAGYSAHFAELITEESGRTVAVSGNEVATVVGLLRHAQTVGASDHDVEVSPKAGVLGIAGGVGEPLAGVMRQAIPALLTGHAVIVKSVPEAPSVLFALAELTARCDFPGGIFNLVHGEEATAAALRMTGTPLLSG